MKHLLHVLLLACPMVASAQVVATDQKGNTFLIHEDGTWTKGMDKSGEESNVKKDAEKKSPEKKLTCPELISKGKGNTETKKLTVVGSFEDRDYIAFKGIKSKNETLFVFVCGSDIECVGSKSYFIFEFTNGSRLKIMNTAVLNCDGRFSFNYKANNARFKVFTGSQIRRMKLVSGRSTIEREVTTEQGNEMMTKINCLLQG